MIEFFLIFSDFSCALGKSAGRMYITSYYSIYFYSKIFSTEVKVPLKMFCLKLLTGNPTVFFNYIDSKVVVRYV
jgi:hypothetical protein